MLSVHVLWFASIPGNRVHKHSVAGPQSKGGHKTLEKTCRQAWDSSSPSLPVLAGLTMLVEQYLLQTGFYEADKPLVASNTHLASVLQLLLNRESPDKLSSLRRFHDRWSQNPAQLDLGFHVF